MFLQFESNDSKLMETVKRKAQPYFERGYNTVIEQRQIHSFDEAADIIKPKLLDHGLGEDLAEGFACVFARSYISGVVAAARLVAPDLVTQFASLSREDRPLPALGQATHHNRGGRTE